MKWACTLFDVAIIINVQMLSFASRCTFDIEKLYVTSFCSLADFLPNFCSYVIWHRREMF